MRISLDRAAHPSRHDALAWRALRLELPELSELAADAPRRWAPDPDWSPAGTLLLVRHVSYSSERRFHSNHLTPPRGYRLESIVGLVQNDPLPGTRRLTLERDVVRVDDALEEPPVEQLPLGHAEQLPYVGLVALELWRVPSTGQEVLVGDPADPLRSASDFVRRVGFVETVPASPSGAPERPRRWGMRVLTRRLDRERSRHVYALESPDAPREPGAARLGGVWHAPGPGLVETAVGPSPPARENALGWVLAPLRWAGPVWGPRAALARAARLARLDGAQSGAERLGHLRREPAVGWSELFSAVHPVTGDRFLTRSALEATDLGYRVEGVAGHVEDSLADRGPVPGPDIPWASRFGRAARYAEGSPA